MNHTLFKSLNFSQVTKQCNTKSIKFNKINSFNRIQIFLSGKMLIFSFFFGKTLKIYIKFELWPNLPNLE